MTNASGWSGATPTYGQIYVGMSGFSYPEWVGDFYPAGTKRDGMLAYYATRFSAVEINMTFRRQAAEKTLENWRAAVGDGFKLTMKAHQRITHWKKLVDTGEDVDFFLKRVQLLGERLGVVLFQVPPTLQFDAGVMDSFFSSLPPGAIYAFEPRNESFTSDAADEIFGKHGIARCLNDDLFDPFTYRVTGPVAYFRFHREGSYSLEDLAERAALAARIASQGTDVYAFFSHEDNPESVQPALRFQSLVSAD